MSENVFYQSSFELLKNDIQIGKLPGAILLSGPEFSGKLTTALEIARILTCSGDKSENCNCDSCRRNNEIINPNVLIAGSRECLLEIKAMKNVMVQGYSTISYIRAVRKLISRFSEILWADSDKFSKIIPLIENIEEDLSNISITQINSDKIEKICGSIQKNCEKLEEFLYDSIPIEQIRGASSWLRLHSNEGKKVFIIENADRMLDAARNALLKILEEPPIDVIFILTTAKRGAIMQTILSRVRVYNFVERTAIEQRDILSKVFYTNQFTKIADCIHSYLPLTPTEIKSVALNYYNAIKNGQIPSVDSVVKNCASFEPRILFKMFLEGIMESCGDFTLSSLNTAIAEKNLHSIKDCYNNVTTYNQNIIAALEKLSRDLAMNIRILR